MARPRPQKKQDKQLDLPTPTPAPAPPTTIRVLPMELRIGDRLADERGEWQVIGQPYTTSGGKMAHAQVASVKQLGVTDIRTWGAHERVSVKRASAEEGKR